MLRCLQHLSRLSTQAMHLVQHPPRSIHRSSGTKDSASQISRPTDRTELSHDVLDPLRTSLMGEQPSQDHSAQDETADIEVPNTPVDVDSWGV